MRAGPWRRLPSSCAAVASVACLAAAFAAAGLAGAACLAALPVALPLFREKTARGWPAHAFLVAMVCAAAAAAVVGAPAPLVVPAGAFALAAWDLAEHERRVRAARPRKTRDSRDREAAEVEEPSLPDEQPEEESRIEEMDARRHAASCAKALALGLLAAGGGFLLSVRIPFALMLLLVILDLACIAYALRLLRS